MFWNWEWIWVSCLVSHITDQRCISQMQELRDGDCFQSVGPLDICRNPWEGLWASKDMIWRISLVKSNCSFKLWLLNYVVAQSLSPVHLFASHELQHTRLPCPSLLIKIGVITINILLPTRNKFVYSCSIKIHASGFDEFLESIFLLLLVVEAFSPQKVAEMLEEVVNHWQEVRWIW